MKQSYEVRAGAGDGSPMFDRDREREARPESVPPESAPESPLASLNVPEATEMVKAEDSADELRRWHAIEKRKMVRDAIEERLGEIDTGGTSQEGAE